MRFLIHYVSIILEFFWPTHYFSMNSVQQNWSFSRCVIYGWSLKYMEVNCKNELWVNLHSPIYNFKFFSLDLKGFHIFPGWKSTYQCAHIYYWNPLKNPGPPRGWSNSMKNGYEINFGIFFSIFQFFFSILIILFIGWIYFRVVMFC